MLRSCCCACPGTCRYFSVSSQRGKQLQPIDALKGYVFEVASMPEKMQASPWTRGGLPALHAAALAQPTGCLLNACTPLQWQCM